MSVEGLFYGICYISFVLQVSGQTTLDNDSTVLGSTSGAVVPSCQLPGIKYPVGIEYDELREGLENGSILLIDVRSTTELQQNGKLEGSVNLPLPELEEAFRLSDKNFLARYKFKKPSPEDQNVVVSCASGRRAKAAYDLLASKGYCDIRVYFGSFTDWKAKGGPLVFD